VPEAGVTLTSIHHMTDELHLDFAGRANGEGTGASCHVLPGPFWAGKLEPIQFVRGSRTKGAGLLALEFRSGQFFAHAINHIPPRELGLLVVGVGHKSKRVVFQRLLVGFGNRRPEPVQVFSELIKEIQGNGAGEDAEEGYVHGESVWVENSNARCD